MTFEERYDKYEVTYSMNEEQDTKSVHIHKSEINVKKAIAKQLRISSYFRGRAYKILSFTRAN